MLTRPVLLLTASVGIIGANSLVLSPIAGAVASSFAAVDSAGVMVAAAAYGLGTAISALGLAPIADRIGAERALLRAMAGLIAALAASALAPALWALCAAQASAGLAAACSTSVSPLPKPISRIRGATRPNTCAKFSGSGVNARP